MTLFLSTMTEKNVMPNELCESKFKREKALDKTVGMNLFKVFDSIWEASSGHLTIAAEGTRIAPR